MSDKPKALTAIATVSLLAIGGILLLHYSSLPVSDTTRYVLSILVFTVTVDIAAINWLARRRKTSKG
jgi:hypothetical protein